MIIQWRNRLVYPTELMEWAASRPEATFYDLWDETIDPEWLFYLAEAWGATRQQLVFAACGVARLCLPMNETYVSLETAEAWCRGEATEYQVRKCPTDAFYYAVNSINTSYYSASTIYTLRAGIKSPLICATIRKHLPFERPPRPKGLTIWQRLAKED